MTREEYYKAYTALEADAKAGRRSWESVCAQIAMLTIDFAIAQERTRAAAERSELWVLWDAESDTAVGGYAPGPRPAIEAMVNPGCCYVARPYANPHNPPRVRT